MNRLAVFLVFIVAVSFVSPHSLGRFFIEEPLRRGDIGTAYITIRNNFDAKLEDVNVRLYFYDIDLFYTSKPNDISKDDHIVQRVFMPIPWNARPGNYLAKMVVGNDKFRDTQHIYLRIV